MPGGVLSEAGAAPEEIVEAIAEAGLFGKLPATGDFVARGLPDALRLRWDAWVARHLAPRAGSWPPGGLRLRIVAPGRSAAGLARPSRDAAGRAFPLTALVLAPWPPARAAVDQWCDAAAPLLDAAAGGGLDADALWAALRRLPPPGPLPATDDGPPAPFLLWAAGGAAWAPEPDRPAAALDALLGAAGGGPVSPEPGPDVS